jgi:hypothetical protein
MFGEESNDVFELRDVTDLSRDDVYEDLRPFYGRRPS